MIIIYVDMVLLAILMALVVFTCGYCWYRVRRLRQSGQVAILLRPTKVLFSHKKEQDATGQLRTVVAYQNPFTGDYCVNKNRTRAGYVNETERRVRERWSETEIDSPDSGLSDEYEPLNLEPQRRNVDEPTKPLTNSLLTRNMNSARHHESLSTHATRENNSLSTQSARDNHSLSTHSVLQNNSLRYKNSIRDKNRVDKTWNWNYKEYQI